MPKKRKNATLDTQDPNLQEGVKRHDRTQRTYGGLLIAYGLLAQIVAVTQPGVFHPIAGLPFIFVGFFAWAWREPALLPAMAALFITSIVPTIARVFTIPGPDPVVLLTNASGWEVAALVAVKAFMGLSAFQQFFQFRLLYGTAWATSDEPGLPVIPELVPNRTDTLARWARGAAVVGVMVAALALAFALNDPRALGTQVAAEVAGALGVLGVGLGLGAAFSPTTERPAALVGLAGGTLAYGLGMVALAL